MRNIEYEEIRLLKHSDKSTVLLVREKGGERVFVEKILKGSLPVYSELLGCSNPYLPKLYEAGISDNTTTVIEEYIDGQPLDCEKLTEKQVLAAVRELCSVLEFLHGKGIIHRDIKPSNILLAKDGHIRLIDFDAARMKRDGLEQDTRLLGTRGYAPPEQYGFSQTDARADIYSLGVTLEQLFPEKAYKPRYRRIVQKCTNLDPDKRYQSARQVKKAFSCRKRGILYGCIALLLMICVWCVVPHTPMQPKEQPVAASPAVLPAPENPHWDGETGIAVWGSVPESGSNGEATYRWRLYYREDTTNPPDVNESEWGREGTTICGWDSKKSLAIYKENLGYQLQQNGYYYFAVSAVGDGAEYTDSPYVMSADPFHYTGENAPQLPAPTGLAWKTVDDDGPQQFATWSNLDDYVDTDGFIVSVYDQEGTQASRNIWTKQDILTIGHGGVWFDSDIFAEPDASYRFTVQVQTSRPNEYKSVSVPDPVPEEYFSPWYSPSAG